MKFRIWLEHNFSSIVKLSVIIIAFIMPILLLFLIWTNYNSTQHQLSELIDILKNTEGQSVNLDSIVNLNGEFGFNIFISLIDITIAVWLGLNIYNSLKKDNFDDLERIIKDKCNEHEKLQMNIGETGKKIEKVYQQHRALHNSYLLKAFDVNSNSAHYFYEMLQKINSNNMSYQFILYATYLETVYTQITTLHNQNEHYKMKPYIMEGIKKYDALKDILSSMDLNNDVKNYGAISHINVQDCTFMKL